MSQNNNNNNSSQPNNNPNSSNSNNTSNNLGNNVQQVRDNPLSLDSILSRFRQIQNQPSSSQMASSNPLRIFNMSSSLNPFLPNDNLPSSSSLNPFIPNNSLSSSSSS